MIASYELRMVARTQISDLQLVDSLHEFVGGLVIVASHMHTNQRASCRKHVF
jgi:hypothetical protein